MAQNRNQIVSSCDGREKVFKHGVRNFGNGGNSIKRIVHYKRVKKFPFSVQNGANCSQFKIREDILCAKFT